VFLRVNNFPLIVRFVCRATLTCPSVGCICVVLVTAVEEIIKIYLIK
jgi:hypothetical protein